MKGSCAQNTNHRHGEGTRNYCVYTVYDNRTDMPVIVDGSADECAKAMKITKNSFHCLLVRQRKGISGRWTIIKTYLDGRPQYTGYHRKEDAHETDLHTEG